jgi:hypothetical protein
LRPNIQKKRKNEIGKVHLPDHEQPNLPPQKVEKRRKRNFWSEEIKGKKLNQEC